MFPEAVAAREKMKPISEQLTRIEFTANKRLVEKLERLKYLLAHKNYDGRMDALVEELADIALKKLDPELMAAAKPDQKHDQARPVAQRKVSTSQSEPKVRSRYIAKPTRTKVWISANSQCQYVHPITGLRCDGKHGLQIDHVTAFSRGGDNNLENLQLLCGAHNRWKGNNL